MHYNTRIKLGNIGAIISSIALLASSYGLYKGIKTVLSNKYFDVPIIRVENQINLLEQQLKEGFIIPPERLENKNNPIDSLIQEQTLREEGLDSLKYEYEELGGNESYQEAVKKRISYLGAGSLMGLLLSACGLGVSLTHRSLAIREKKEKSSTQEE